MFSRIEDRIDRVVEDLLKGRRLRGGSTEAEERSAIVAAAALAAGREAHPRMSPQFRRRLAADLRRSTEPGWITRRTAIGAVAGLAAGAAGAAALTHLPGATRQPEKAASTLAGGLMTPGGGRWVEVAALSALSEAEPTRVVAGDVVAFLFRTGDQVRGVSGICTHQPCVLHWTSGALNCPCHNVDFNEQGNVQAAGYGVPPLPIVKVKVEGGRVLVYSP